MDATTVPVNWRCLGGVNNRAAGSERGSYSRPKFVLTRALSRYADCMTMTARSEMTTHRFTGAHDDGTRGGAVPDGGWHRRPPGDTMHSAPDEEAT